MPPPRTMALGQHTSLAAVGQQKSGDMKQNTIKPKKRKGKHQTGEQPADHVQKSAIVVEPSLSASSNRNHNKQNVSEVSTDLPTKKQTTIENPALKSIERTTLNKDSSKQGTKESAKKPDLSNGVKRLVQTATGTQVPIAKNKELVSEEADEIDAGIELDGSSNSGSSVKDIGEDQKSASVSPVMSAQSIGLQTATTASSEATHGSKTSSHLNRQTAEVTPIDKVNGTICTAAKLQSTLPDESPKLKKSSSSATKQQLAANQQVIDADEQQLQQKLQNKQKKLISQDSGASLDESSVLESNDDVGSKKVRTTSAAATNNLEQKATMTKVKPRRFSSQSSQESVDTSSCKVCGQHVYQMEKMLAEKSIYHKRCFRCHQCKIQLRVDNYSSHEGQVYCKAHHKQLFQPQVKFDTGNDVDIVAKSTTKPVDDYLLHRGRLSELSFSFLQPKPQELLKRQMIICENEPAELPKDVVRSDTKLDDGIDHLNLNLNNILEKFERGTTSVEESQPSSAGVVIEKPSFNIRKTLMAFESKTSEIDEKRCEKTTDKPVVKKLTNLDSFLNRQSSQENENPPTLTQSMPVKRSESLMMRLKKYESRIAGEQIADDNHEDSDDENNNLSEFKKTDEGRLRALKESKVNSINLSSLKSKWESGVINNNNSDDVASDGDCVNSASDDKIVGSVSGDMSEELTKIRQQLARKKSGDSASVKNIYENAIKEAQQQQQALRRESADLSALEGFSTTTIQQKLLKRTESSLQKSTTPNKDHFQLNLSNRANKLKERFELGLINNSSLDDSDHSDGDEAPISKLEQIRQEKLEDLSIFTEGEIKAREARNMFQQIDKRISAANGGGRQPVVNSRSLASVQDAMRNKLTNRIAARTQDIQTISPQNLHHHQSQDQLENRPIRLTNNVRI